jgi:four helix bundle protein
MRRPELLDRTQSFALAIIRFHNRLPQRADAWTLGRQLLRSGTSIGANYREAQRARSTPEFISKVHIAAQEAEESAYWLSS